MAQEATTGVLICGAGAAGLSLAIDLGRRRVDFRLIEKAETPFRGSRGKGIQPRSQEVLHGAAGQPTRLFSVLQGPHWTLLGYQTDRSAVAPRPGLRVHMINGGRDLVDDAGHFRDAYGLSRGDWVLIRPDGYIGAIVGTDGVPALERYLTEVGLTGMGRATA